MTDVPAADTVVVLDFETTGLSPGMGDRALEIGAVKLSGGLVVGQFQELMHPGQRVSRAIENYTGISNEMLVDARSCSEVMRDFAQFIKGHNLVAHNASFDKRFLDAELDRINMDYSGQFSCSMLAARRIYQYAPNHQLGTLVSHINIPSGGTFHRALYDSEMTGKLWIAMLDNIRQRSGQYAIPFSFMQRLVKTPKAAVDQLLTLTTTQ